MNRKKIEIEEELNVKKGKIADLERLITDLKKQLDEEIRKQKMSSEALLEDLVALFLLRKGNRRGRSGSWRKSWRRLRRGQRVHNLSATT